MPKRIKIGNRWIGEGEPTFVIAEVGINHQGDMKIAEKLIDVASFAGADSVKFQKRNIDRLLTKESKDKPYDHPNSFGPTYGEHRKALELSEESFRYLKKYAESKRLVFLVSAWDEDSADFLESINVVAFKIPSADLNNPSLLEYIAKKKRPMFISTGMSDMEEVETAYHLVGKHTDQIILMQCTATYPSDFDELNLRVIQAYNKKFDCPVGYSGHERGIAIAVAAVTLGACVIERHITLDRTWKGSDHAASLEPHGLQTMIRDIRATEKALGDGIKRKFPSEKSVAERLQKSLTSAKPIMVGTRITAEHLTAKCPGTGIPPSDIDRLIGRIANRNIDDDKILRWEYFD